jgi:hypothetical protein
MLVLVWFLAMATVMLGQSFKPNDTASFKLKWGTNAEPDVVRYEVFVSTNSFVAQANANPAYLTNTTMITVLGRTNTTLSQSNYSPAFYYLSIRAVSQWELASPLHPGITGDFRVPGTVANLSLLPAN